MVRYNDEPVTDFAFQYLVVLAIQNVVSQFKGFYSLISFVQ